MKNREYCHPRIDEYAMLNHKGFAASFNSDANAGSNDFYIRQGASNEDSTWE